MKVQKIFFEQLFPTGEFQNQRLGVEITLEAEYYNAEVLSIAVIDAFKQAKSLTQKAFQEINPNHQPPEQSSSNVSTSLPEINREAERVEAAIDDATTLDDLKKLFDAALKWKLENQYMMKMNLLQSK